MTDITVNKDNALKELLKDIIKAHEMLYSHVFFVINSVKEMENTLLINRVKTDIVLKLLNEEIKSDQDDERNKDD